MQQTHFNYIILGGGISGLTIAHELQNRGNDVCVLEKKSTAGGVLSSVVTESSIWDTAAHTIAVDEDLMNILDDMELSTLLQEPSAVAKERQIVINGKIQNIAIHPLKILTSNFLSFKAKIKLIQEFSKKPISLENPTVGEFFRYHFGEEITRNLVSAVFSGIYSGDIDRMEMKSVMGKIFEMEQSSGSVIRGLVKQSKASGKRKIFGVGGGMKQLMQAMSASLSDIFYDEEVLTISKDQQTFTVKTAKDIFSCNHLISTLPAHALSPLVSFLSSVLSEKLGQIYYAPMILIHAAFKVESNHRETAAFGFLCSQYDSPHLKGAIYNSDLFPDRAKEDHKTYTIFMKPEAEWLSDEVVLDKEVEKIVEEFKTLTKINGSPTELKKSIWAKGIPQFNKPYQTLKAEILEEASKIKGLTVSGSFISGVSIPDCIKYNKQLGKVL